MKQTANCIIMISQINQSATLRFSFTVCCLIISFTSLGQNHNIKFEHLDINSGLSQNHIMCVLQDNRGFMWFGTRDGLNKYDGYKFTVYKNYLNDSTSISNNFISGLVEDSKGNIWIATRGGGLNKYDKEKNTFTRFKNDPKNSHSISSDLVTSLVKDNEDNLWLCTEDGGLNYFEPRINRFTHYTYNAECVFEDSEHNVWVGGRGSGLNIFNKKTKTFTPFRYNLRDSGIASSSTVKVIFEDISHQLWVGTNGNGLYSLNKNTGKFYHFIHENFNANSIPNNIIYAIGENADGNIFIGTENGGLCVYNPVAKTFQLYQHDEVDNLSISHNSIYSIYKAANGDMWIGTFAGGVNIINKNSNRFEHFKHTSAKNSLNNNNILCMLESSNGKLLIGTDGGGLNLFNAVTREFTQMIHEEGNSRSICGNYILSVCEDTEKNIWIGSWGNGLTIFNPQKNTYTHYENDSKNSSSLSNNNVWVIFKDRDENIWIGTYGGGLNLYNPRDKSFTKFDDGSGNPSTRKIQSITEDIKGNLWLATDGGGFQVFNKNTKAFTTFTHNDHRNSLSDNRVNYTYEDSKGNFWINTMSGLNYFDTRRKVFTTYTTADGLPNNVIFGLMEDAKGCFWISTNRGLSHFNPQTLKFKNYGVEDGLQSFEFKMRAFCKSSSGAMYFGGINGFNEFYPDKINQDTFEPPLVLTNFQVFNKDVTIAKNSNDPSPLKKDISEAKEIVLPYKYSVFSFQFASLNYTVEEKKQYAYMLDGFDKNWNEIGTNRTATYTNLDPGKYIFKVKGLNNEGNWSSRSIAFHITITPPFWLTWWFKIGLLVTITSGIIGFYKFRIKTIKAQKRKLQQQVERQTSQLIHSTHEEQKARKEAEQLNKDLERKNKELEEFAYVASHDLQEPLRTTSSFVGLLQKQYRGKLDDKADKYFTYILEASDRMKVLIKNLLDYSRIGNKKDFERVDCDKLLHNVLADLSIAISEAGAEIKHDPLPVIIGYPTELKQLFQNLITNAIKFRKTDTSPQINISVKKMDGYWQFAFKDNGIGIEEKHSEKIFVIFQRLHTRTEYEGTGIGLSYCKKIVELHKGRIWVESVPGFGSTFYFTILSPNEKLNDAKLKLHTAI